VEKEKGHAERKKAVGRDVVKAVGVLNQGVIEGGASAVGSLVPAFLATMSVAWW
jgi:hypothetical protein